MVLRELPGRGARYSSSRSPSRRSAWRGSSTQCVLDFLQLNLARIFAGFTCGVELWSFLENAAQLSDAPLFRWLRRYVRRRIRKEVEP